MANILKSQHTVVVNRGPALGGIHSTFSKVSAQWQDSLVNILQGLW
jgi:hypothetical protein